VGPVGGRPRAQGFRGAAFADSLGLIPLVAIRDGWFHDRRAKWRKARLMSPLTPVVILGEGYAGATMMGVVRSLGRLKVPVHVFSPHPHSPARFSRYCRHHHVPDAVRQPDDLEKRLIEFAKSLPSPPVLFPVGDGDVMFVSDRTERLRPYYRFNLAHPELIQTLVNKRTQYRVISGSGIPIPSTYFDLTSANAGCRDVRFPVVIKPAYSHLWPQRGEIKALGAENREQLQERLKDMEDQKIQVVVQSIVPGPPSELYTVVHILVIQAQWRSLQASESCVISLSTSASDP
jgi:predicted ATP-grasp superfamily ATP-dependent carboligase